MNESFQSAKGLIEKSHNIILTTHERTDGDDLGTVLALYSHLRAVNKNARLIISGGTPAQLQFLPHSNLVNEIWPLDFNADLIILSGCSKPGRTGIPQVIETTLPTINFDHHPDNTNFATLNVVDANKSAVAELMYDFFKYSNWPITKDAAQCMLTGIFTDTGSFMHSNTKSSTMHAASELMSKGASINKIAKNTYSGKNQATLKAWSKALENTFYDPEKKIIYSVVTDKDLEELKNISLSAFEGFVETLNKVPDAKVAMFLKQDGNVIKGSLRSDPHKGVNVQQIAKVLGGGGHMWASGFSLVGKLEKDEKGIWGVKTI